MTGCSCFQEPAWGFESEVRFSELVAATMQADLRAAEREAPVQRYGCLAYDHHE